MTDEWPSEIEVIGLADGVRYRLPRRKLGPLGCVAVGPLLFGLVFMGIPLTGTVLALFGAGAVGDPVGGLFAGLMIIPFVLVGAGMVYFGLNMLFGRAEIDLTTSRITSSDRLGLFSWARSQPTETAQRLVVLGRYENEARRPGLSSGLRLECGNGKSLRMAVGYPFEWASPLASDFSRRWAELLGKPDVLYVVEEIKRRQGGSDPDIVIGYEPVVGEAPRGLPAASQVAVDEDAGGVTLTVPAPGMRNSYSTLLILGLAISGIVAAVGAGLLTAVGKVDWGGLACGLPVALLFEVIGVAMVVGAIDGARRQAMLAVAGGKLLVLSLGPLGTRRREWAVEEVQDVRVGPSGTVINGVPVMELQVHPRQGSKYGLLGGRDDSELEWIAAKLRAAIIRKPQS